ncbi:MAG: dihydroneopterin aldolase [Rhodobacteraceae bacterium]|jgi:dihydroneopterin aldolase|nr:dihydroneopterin aldolase [Paracoccaceae bacterium]NCV30748.1 dihydroneopterin aldolase [Paracoccaceae bacterium]NCV68308.1 dihydroneopterin aldolase [Paracoccaceae bacterium]NCW04745.1 dihydroneopterin aldolase [Paracoccaceae bacterium]NCW61933.1 dihydroneopterin aldolase [Paracoccaceae bacterium]
MTKHAQIRLNDLTLPCTIGTYEADDIIPDAHVLDMVLYLDKSWVVIDADQMNRVFDYDPLISKILQIAATEKYETQEYLMSLIFQCCFVHAEVHAAELFLRKSPVRDDGSLGVQVTLTRAEFEDMRSARN